MLLAVDIGNSNIVFGVWGDEKWVTSGRFETYPVDVTQYKSRSEELLNEHKSRISDIIISSVVPAASQPMADLLSSLLRSEPELLDATFDLGIVVQTDHPEKVGTDLIADAAGAYHLVRDNCVVVDFGTATTIIAVEKPGALTGAAICAGLKASKEALAGKTAQLFDVPLEPPSSVLGKNTIEAMQSGLVLGHIAMVEGLVERMKKKTGPAKVVATGGLVEMLAPLTDLFDFVEPMLTLDGLRLIAEQQIVNRKSL